MKPQGLLIFMINDMNRNLSIFAPRKLFSFNVLLSSSPLIFCTISIREHQACGESSITLYNDQSTVSLSTRNQRLSGKITIKRKRANYILDAKILNNEVKNFCLISSLAFFNTEPRITRIQI